MVANLPSPIRSIGGRSKEQWSKMDGFSDSDNPFQPTLKLSTPPRDTPSRTSARRAGSGPRSQWAAFDQPKRFARSATRAAKELDSVLGCAAPAAAPSSSDDTENDDDDDDDITSRASYDHSEATAKTGNFSSMSASPSARATPDTSPREGSRGIGDDQGGGGGRRGRSGRSPASPRRGRDGRSSRRPGRGPGVPMCGAAEVNDELKESLRDVNDTVRQILATVRRFGSDEKDAVRETIRDARFFVRERVRGMVLSSRGSGEDDSDDDCSGSSSPGRARMDVSPSPPRRRRSREAKEGRGSTRGGRRRERGAKEKARTEWTEGGAKETRDKNEPKRAFGTRMLV